MQALENTVWKIRLMLFSIWRDKREKHNIDKWHDKKILTGRKEIIIGIIMLLYVAIHIALINRHEFWRDESQAWVLAKNSSIPDLFKLCCSEGHPILWFLIVKLFLTMRLPFSAFGFISVLFMTLSAFFFLAKAPFRLSSKICILLSPLFFYYNPIICRIYSVVILLIVLFAVMETTLRKKSIIFADSCCISSIPCDVFWNSIWMYN